MSVANATDWFAEYAGPASGLPLVGTIDLCAGRDNGGARADAMSRQVGEMIAWHGRVVNGDAAGFADWYATVPKGCRAFCLVAHVAVLATLQTRDMVLFRTVWEDVGNFPTRWPTPEGKMAAEILSAWIRQLCYVSDGYPDWLVRFDCSDVPSAWRYSASYVGIKIMLVQHRYEAALAAISVFQLFQRADRSPEFVDIWLSLACADAHRELGRSDEMVRWFRRAAHQASGLGHFLPFLAYSLGSGSPLASSLQSVAPDLVPKVSAHADNYFQTVLLMHNFLTGRQVTMVLSRREFYVARCLRRGHSYRVIAGRIGVSVGRARNIVSGVYAKLQIHSRSELVKCVF